MVLEVKLMLDNAEEWDKGDEEVDRILAKYDTERES